jgi:hypothetical protein
MHLTRSRRLLAIAASAAVALASVAAEAQETEDDPEAEEIDAAAPATAGVTPPYFPFNLSLLWPLATNFATPDLWTHLDVAILLGRVGFVDGLQLGVCTWITHELRGIQLGVASAIEERGAGVQIGAGFTFADGLFEGIQAAGVFSWASKDLHGLMVGGAANQIYGDLDGVQLAGAFNIARKQVTGVQAGGFVNIGKVDGLQVGAINVSARQRGLQIGIINVARRIDGLQIGVVNITDDLEGESLGIAPLPRRGGIRAHVWGSSSLLGNVGVKFSSRYAYSILSGSVTPVDREDGGPGKETKYGFGLTLGAQMTVPSVEELRLAADLGVTRLFMDAPSFAGHDEMVRARVLVSYAIARRLAPFVGGGVWTRVHGEDDLDAEVGPEISVGLEL